ncbi:Ada metal-binding domain-containing protein [Clostridium fessum]|uniref:Ada metal-binding domain-containing protein n=1 Tax=Clostridium fessum TaxID=2126740 RepID=UPI0022E025EA|nr:Ada metal-binding domain-containing protein [Clostridium fessum]
MTFNINYATGDSSASGTNKTAETEQATQAASQQTNTESYILNTNTKKFHRPSCSSVKQMKESNKKSSSESRDALIAAGYDPCKKCNP